MDYKVFDWVSFLDFYGISYRDSGPGISRGWVGVNCPNHSPVDVDYYGGCNLEYGSYNCWYCKSTSVLDTICNFLGVTRSEAYSIHNKFKRIVPTAPQKHTRFGTQSYLELPKSPLSIQAKAYLSKRFIGPETVNRYDLRYSDVSDPTWRHRIILPIIFNDKIVGATGRTILPGCEPRYYTLPPERSVLNHKHTLYGWQFVLNRAVVVEGPIDSVRGGSGFVSIYGSSISDEQLLLLSSLEEVIILLDNDAAANKVRDKIAHTLDLISDTKVYNAHWKSGHKDTGELDPGLIKEFRKELQF